LIDTKDIDNNQTLLHFLVKHMQKKYPKVTSFVSNDFLLIPKAARVSPETIAKSLEQLKQSVQRVCHG
jgi:hypothetical protein